MQKGTLVVIFLHGLRPLPISKIAKKRLCHEILIQGNLRKNVKFQFFGDRMEKKHFIFIIGALKYRSSHSSKSEICMKFGVSKKIMRPNVTLLNIFSEIAP